MREVRQEARLSFRDHRPVFGSVVITVPGSPAAATRSRSQVPPVYVVKSAAVQAFAPAVGPASACVTSVRPATRQVSFARAPPRTTSRVVPLVSTTSSSGETCQYIMQNLTSGLSGYVGSHFRSFCPCPRAPEAQQNKIKSQSHSGITTADHHNHRQKRKLTADPFDSLSVVNLML